MPLQGACCTAFVDGQRATSAPDLEKLLQASAANRPRAGLPAGHSNDSIQHFPFDHIYKHVHAAGDPFPQTHSKKELASNAVAEAGGKGATMAVLYGMIGTGCFRDMHALLASGVRDSAQPGMPAVALMLHPEARTTLPSSVSLPHHVSTFLQAQQKKCLFSEAPAAVRIFDVYGLLAPTVSRPHGGCALEPFADAALNRLQLNST